MTKFYRNASMVIMLALLASGCLAPLSNSFTARSLGKGKIGLDGGISALVRQEGSVILPAFAIAVGLSSDFDLGVQMESASIGLFGKYSFINNKERGFSLAGVLGAGAVASGSYAYAGPVLSYKSKAVEPYFVGRFNYVHYGKSDNVLDMEPGTYTYVQFTLGSIFWLTQSFGLNVEGSAFAGNFGQADFEDFGASSFVVLVGIKIRF
ncbi:MAG: hypothetical protein MUQ25_12355 [Candidatus Aminicenantes bacterium]|nr:hypothetical protein [Candidatus Aminicenantes bacterium]